MKPLRLPSLSLAALVLAACATGAVSVQSEIGSAYDFSNFGAYHTGRDTRVEIHGNTFGMEPSAFAAAVTRNMQGQNSGGRTNFTATAGPGAAARMRVVLAFDVAPASASICTAGRLSPAREAGTTLQAAWCFADRLDSYVMARTATVRAADDPAFASLVGQAVRSLFPTVRDHKINEITDGN